jgi:hypothetical protein
MFAFLTHSLCCTNSHAIYIRIYGLVFVTLSDSLVFSTLGICVVIDL